MKKVLLPILIFLLSINITVGASVKQPTLLSQYDNKWTNEPYTILRNSSQTIGSSGCGPTCMAMVLGYYVDKSITPIQTSVYAIENSHRTSYSGTSWGYFKEYAEEYDLEFLQTSSSTDVKKWMQEKNDPLVVCSMGPGTWGSQGHFVLLWELKNGIAYINDPASTSANRLQNKYSVVSGQCKQYFCFNKPKDKVSKKLLKLISQIRS